MRAAIGPILALTVLAGSRVATGEQPIEVTVRGERDSASKQDATAASTVLTGEALKQPGATASDALERVPGVHVERTGSSSDLSTASVRGATSAQFPVYLAGIRLNDDVAGTADLSQVPLWMIERVEVFRGAAPARADRLGIGGAVFFEPRLPNRTRVGGEVSVGSFGFLSTGVGYEVAKNGSGALFSLVRDRADNDYEYLDDRGTRAVTSDDRSVRRSNADHTAYDAWVVGRTKTSSSTRVATVVNAFEREQGVTGFLVIPARAARARIRRELGGLDTSFSCSSGDACVLELSASAVHARTLVSDPLGEIGLTGAWLSTRALRANFSERVRLFPDDASEIALALAQESETLDLVSPQFSLPASRRLLGATLSANRSLTRAFSVHALGRVDCQDTRGPSGADGASCAETDFSGRLGARLEVGRDLAALLNLGRYVRSPTLGELFGQSPLVQGNPELSPERGLAADVGIRGIVVDAKDATLSVDAFLFARDTRDLVSYERSSFGFLTPYNVARGRTLGGELGVQAEVGRALDASLALTALDPVDTTPGRRLANDLIPFQSRLQSRAELELFVRRPLSFEWVERASLGASFTYRSSSVADPAGLIVIPSSDLVEAFSKLALFEDRLALRMSIDNLFDVMKFDRVGFPVPGRSVNAGAEVWW